MKKKIITSISFVLLIQFVGAQSVVEVNTICDNEVSTDWNDPTNNNLPLIDHDNDPNTPGIPDERYLNGLDWVNGNTAGNGYSTVGMEITQNVAYGNMTNVKPLSQGNAWYDYLFYGETMSPENGWEMLLHNLGYYPNAEDEHSFEEHKYTPYIVLYNRYTGVIRVFVTYGRNPIPNDAIDGVKVDLSFAVNELNPNDPANVYSGVFRHGDPMDVALDQNTEITKMSAVAKTPGTVENKWFSVDFQAAYDPCTCIYPSRLRLRFNWFSETDFALNGRQLTLTEDLTDPTAQDLVDKDFLGSFELVGEDAEQGFIIYSSMEAAVDDYLKQMEKYQTELNGTNANNAKIKRNIAIMKAFKAVILGGANPTSTAISGVSITAALAGGESWAADLVTNAADLIKKDTLGYYTLSDAAKKLLGSQFDFFIDKNFKEKPKPTKPTQPVVAYSEMAFKGKLYNDLPIPGPDFMAPGTFNGSSQSNSINEPLPYKYPIYNDVLGTFALLETPRFLISRDVQDEFEKNVSYKYILSQTSPTKAVYQSWTDNFQIKMASDLKFALNSALDIKSYNIELALEIKDSIIEPKVNDKAAIGYWYADGLQQCYSDPKYTTNLTSMNSEVDVMEDIYNAYDFNNGSDYDAPQGYTLYRPWNNNQPNFKKGRVRTFQSEFVPIDAFYQTVYEFGIKNDFLTPIGSPAIAIEPEEYGFKNEIFIELKVKVELEYYTLNEEGENNATSEVYTYIIPKSNFDPTVDGEFNPQASDIVPNLSSSNYNFDFPQNLNFTDVDFDGAIVEGCEKVGNIYKCTALESISLDGEITTSNGYTVEMNAGEEIVEYPGSIINGEVIRQITPFFDYSHPMPQVTENYVVNFCGTTNEPSDYLANELPKEKWEQIQAAEDELNNGASPNDQILDLVLYPVPAKEVLNMKTSVDLTNAQIAFLDMTGRKLDLLVNEINGRTFQVNTSGLAEGLYRVVIESDEGRVTEAFTVTKTK